MKLISLGVILLVASAVSHCQKWCYFLYFGRVILSCCSYDEKAGTCPIGCIDPNRQFQLWAIACNTDQQCPFGYKCCRDGCYRYHKICMVAEFVKKEITTSTKIPTTQTTVRTPFTTQTTTEIPTTTQTTTDIPTTTQTTTDIPTTTQSTTMTVYIQESTTISPDGSPRPTTVNEDEEDMGSGNEESEGSGSIIDSDDIDLF